MNAAEKAKILQANGYERTKTTNGDTVWWFEGMAIAEHESNAKATRIAYDHMYNTNYDFVNPFRDNQAPTETPASEAPQVEAPKFKVGDKVTVKALLPKVYTILLIDPLAANPYLLNTDGGYWYTEDSLSAAPVADAPQVDERPNVVSGDFVLLDILPDMMQEKNERIAKLEAELQKANRVVAAFDAELSKEQQKRIKLQADLSAAQAIIVQAGKDFAALKDENARMLEGLATIAHKAKRIYNGDVDMESAKALALGIYTLSRQDSTPTPPAQEAPATPASDVTLTSPYPKFTVGQPVWVIYSYGREFGLSNKAAVVVEIKQEDGANLYRVRYITSKEEGSQFWEEYQIAERTVTL